MAMATIQARLDAAKSWRRTPFRMPERAIPWLYLASFFGSLSVPLIPHLCRTMHADFLFISFPAAAIAWYLLAAHPAKSFAGRVGAILLTGYSSFILFANLFQGFDWSDGIPQPR